jgi:hypothetical protein
MLYNISENLDISNIFCTFAAQFKNNQYEKIIFIRSYHAVSASISTEPRRCSRSSQEVCN